MVSTLQKLLDFLNNGNIICHSLKSNHFNQIFLYKYIKEQNMASVKYFSQSLFEA